MTPTEKNPVYGRLYSTKENCMYSMPLKSVCVIGAVDDILSTFTIRQTYRNDSTEPITAKYEFTTPLKATLLDFEAQFGERRLKSLIQASGRAAAEYSVLKAGDGPILLDTGDSKYGNYHASFGKLQPGETATIEYRYAMQHEWEGCILRIRVPGSTAPRILPESEDITASEASSEETRPVSPRWQYVLNVTGTLAQSAITCPAQPLSITSANNGLQVSFTALPDCETVLNFEHASRPDAVAVCDRDRDGWIVAADLKPHILGVENSKVNLDILFCFSFKLGETARQQITEGVMRVLDGLGPNNFFNITCDTNSLFEARSPADKNNIESAKRFLDTLHRKKGSLMDSIKSVWQMQGGEGPRSILFITDRFPFEDDLFQEAAGSGCRVMAVHMGTNKPYSLHNINLFVKATDGACECTSSDEEIAKCIYRQGMRTKFPADEKELVLVSETDTRRGAISNVVYDGDTVHVFARYADRPSGKLSWQTPMCSNSLSLTCANPEPASTAPAEPFPSDLARMAAASRLSQMDIQTDKKAGCRLAVDYQLYSAWVDCLLVDAISAGDMILASTGSVERYFEGIQFIPNRNSFYSDTTIALFDRDGDIKWCVPDTNGRPVELDGNSENCLRINPPDSADSFHIICNSDICQLPENTACLRKWIRTLTHSHTDEQIRITQQELMRFLGEKHPATAVLCNSLFHDYMKGNAQEVERYYDTLDRLFRSSILRDLRFRDAGDILLDTDMRIKVVARCIYDPESDETTYSLIDLCTGAVTSGTRERKYKCFFFGDLRYSVYDDKRDDFYSYNLFSNIASIVSRQLMLFGSEALPNAQLLAKKVADNLFKAVSNYPCRDDVPEYDDLLKALTEAFLQVCYGELNTTQNEVL